MTRLCCSLSMAAVAAAPSRSASTVHSLPPAGSRVSLTTTPGRAAADLRCRRRLLSARGEHPDPDEDDDDDEEEEDGPAAGGFEAAAVLFNGGEYHACHDAAEELLWRCADEEGSPARALLHGLLQCAVGMHHLLGRNHRGAMLELGQGLCNLRRLDLDQDSDGEDGRPFARFRDEVAALLAFLYRTQKELAACTEEMCVAMDGSATTYQLLGDFAAGQRLYRLGAGEDGVPAIVFSGAGGGDRSSVKLPVLHATERHLAALQRAHRYSARS